MIPILDIKHPKTKPSQQPPNMLKSVGPIWLVILLDVGLDRTWLAPFICGVLKMDRVLRDPTALISY